MDSVPLLNANMLTARITAFRVIEIEDMPIGKVHSASGVLANDLPYNQVGLCDHIVDIDA